MFIMIIVLQHGEEKTRLIMVCATQFRLKEIDIDTKHTVNCWCNGTLDKVLCTHGCGIKPTPMEN